VPSLSTSQSFALATAAARADGAVLPLPDGFRVRGRARRLMVEGLVQRGLIARRSARHGEPAWAQGGSDLALKITLEGRALVGSTDPSSGDDQPLEPATPPRKRPAVRPGRDHRPHKKSLAVTRTLRRPPDVVHVPRAGHRVLLKVDQPFETQSPWKDFRGRRGGACRQSGLSRRSTWFSI
jgi:hypothetical protein